MSFVDVALAEPMEISAVRMPPDEDELFWAGLEKGAQIACGRPGWPRHRLRWSAR